MTTETMTTETLLEWAELLVHAAREWQKDGMVPLALGQQEYKTMSRNEALQFGYLLGFAAGALWAARPGASSWPASRK